jgi:hypothetical protein
MFARMIVGSLLALSLLASSNLATAGSMKVENYSNSEIDVAVAVSPQRASDNVVGTGWYVIKPGDSATIKFPGPKAWLLVWNYQNGTPVGPFNNVKIGIDHNRTKKLLMPTDISKFQVIFHKDDQNVLTLKRGPDLGNVADWNTSDGSPVPDGWQFMDFFETGNGDKLAVNP